MRSGRLCPFIINLLTIYHNHNAVLALNDEEDHSYWLELGKGDIQRAMDLEPIVGPAKNAILFLGDGMGLTTVTAARIYGKGEGGHLAFDKFPHIGALKTYNADKFVPDSCSTATALFCGVKANYKTSGVDPTVNLDDCEASLSPNAQLESIIKWAQDAGKSTGFVTTTRVTHATPSALYAHTPNRNWECEATIPSNGQKCKDIARQLVEDDPGRSINVIMGGGRQCLQSNVPDSPGDPVDTWACYSKDGRDLMATWQLDKNQRNLTGKIVTNNEELQKLDPKTDFVLGIFANGHLKMEYERDKGPEGMPSLSNMTQKTLEVLGKNPAGYVLMVEGGLIDFAHHRGHARQALDETVAFSDAIDLAVSLVDFKDTLIVVTSDHAHSMVFSGYSSRQANILDVAQESKMDGVPYTSLLYGTGGPNNFQYSAINDTVLRLDPSLNDTTHFGYSQQAAVLTDEVTHSGSDVLVYAKGPMAHLFHSVHEQTYVAYVISYATGIGPFAGINCAHTTTTHLLLLTMAIIIIYANSIHFHK